MINANAFVQHDIHRAIRSDLWARMDAAMVPISPWDPDFQLVITLDTALSGLFPAYGAVPEELWDNYATALNGYLSGVGT